MGVGCGSTVELPACHVFHECDPLAMARLLPLLFVLVTVSITVIVNRHVMIVVQARRQQAGKETRQYFTAQASAWVVDR